MSLKHGKGNFCILFSFSFLKAGGPGSILFRGNGYDLGDNKRDFFEALNMAIAEVLKKDNRTSPNKDFFGVECEVRTMATEGNDSGGNSQGQQSPLQPVAEVDVGNQCRRCT